MHLVKDFLLFISSRQWTHGPKLPKALISPVVITIKDDVSFIFGLELLITDANAYETDCASQEIASENSTVEVYIFNRSHHRNKWINVGDDFPCPRKLNAQKPYSSAYLRPENSVIVAVDGCTAVLGLASFPDSWTWSSVGHPMENNGVVFNKDGDENIVFYIGNAGGNHGSNLTKVYKVSYSTVQWTPLVAATYIRGCYKQSLL